MPQSKPGYCNKKRCGFPDSDWRPATDPALCLAEAGNRVPFPDIFRAMDKSQDIAESILACSRIIAIVGASPNPARPSFMVASYLIDAGFDVIPVRPKVKTILGCKCYGSLEEIPVKVDIVDVFRKPEACPDIARAAVEASAGALWLQEGIISEDAARRAREGGLRVVMDLCIKKVHVELLNTGF